MTKDDIIKLALKALEGCYGHTTGDGVKRTRAITAIRSALAEQPAQCWKCGDMDAAGQAKCTVPWCGMREQPAQQQEPVARIAWVVDTGKGYKTVGYHSEAINALEHGALLHASPQPSKPDFKAFKEWAGAAGYDTAHTHDGIKWICLNPMTAALWNAWQAAHGIKGDA